METAGSTTPCLGVGTASGTYLRYGPKAPSCIPQTGSFPVPSYSGGLRCRGKFVGASGATDRPPVPGCTKPEESTGMSICGLTPSVLPVGAQAGLPSGVTRIALKSVLPTPSRRISPAARSSTFCESPPCPALSRLLPLVPQHFPLFCLSQGL